MKIIDAHVHIGQWNNPDFFGRSLSSEDLFKFYDTWGIDAAVVIPTDRAKNEELLDSIKEYSQERYRFVPWVKPGDKSLFDFYKKNADLIGGLKFHPSLDKTRLTDKPFEDFINFAHDENLPIIVHCGRWEEIAGSKFPLEVAEDRPDLRIVLSHMGGDTPKLAFKTMDTIKKESLKNVYLDIAGFREYWVIEQGVKDLGSDKFFFASDFPLGHPKAAIAMIENMEISEGDKKKIFAENAQRLFKWGVKD